MLTEEIFTEMSLYWGNISFQNEFFVLFVFEKWFISNLKMHIRKKISSYQKIKMACYLIR